MHLDKVPVREGYTFTGWYADKDLTEKIGEIKMTSNKTVYAGWEATGVPDWLNGEDHFAYIIGDDEGYARPLANVTRAEFAAICARFDTGAADGESNFTDISGHWAESEIRRAAQLGWIQGDPDGRFRPNAPIIRAEAMTIINRVLNWLPEEKEDLLEGRNEWPDNLPGAWYYLAVQEATNSHAYERKGEIYEHWTEMNTDPDWVQYQH